MTCKKQNKDVGYSESLGLRHLTSTPAVADYSEAPRCTLLCTEILTLGLDVKRYVSVAYIAAFITPPPRFNLVSTSKTQCLDNKTGNDSQKSSPVTRRLFCSYVWTLQERRLGTRPGRIYLRAVYTRHTGDKKYSLCVPLLSGLDKCENVLFELPPPRCWMLSCWAYICTYISMLFLCLRTIVWNRFLLVYAFAPRARCFDHRNFTMWLLCTVAKPRH